MSLVVIANRLGAYAWDHGPLVAALTRELVGRGHSVTLIADSIEDAAAFDGVAQQTFRPYEQTATAFPIRFPRWAARRAAAVAADRVISLTHRVAAPVWMPIDRSARAWLAHQVSTRNPISLAATLARTPGAFVPFRGRIGAHRTPIAVPPFSLLAPVPSEDERTRVRAMVRSQLDLPADGRMLLASEPEAIGRTLDTLLARLSRRTDDHLVILARDTFTIEHRAAAIGGQALLDRLRILTRTADIRPLLLAADAAAVLPSGLNRFASDAVRMGTPCEPPQSSPRPLTPAEMASLLVSPAPGA